MARTREPFPASTRGDRYGATAAYRSHPHRGQDWAPGDVPAVAITAGTVVSNAWNAALGHTLEIRDGDDLFWGYAHLATASPLKVGTTVELGGSLGAHVGNTGTATTGRHLHVTLSRVKGGLVWADPSQMLDPLARILANDDAPAGPAKPAAAPAKAPRSVAARAGDGLSTIAAREGVTLDRIKALNPAVKGPQYAIREGQKIRVD